MKNQNPQTPVDALDANYWENEIKYFENALEGLQRSYSILSALKQNAAAEYDKLTEPQD